jgi:hypothetical protein
MATTSDLSFSDVSPTLIEQAEEYLVSFLQEQFPSRDFSVGRVTRELVVNMAAIMHAINREDIDRLLKSFSPLVIAADPTAADPDIVDAVYANYGVERYDGNVATGSLAIIISDLITTSVPDTTIFTANGLTYGISQTYIGVTSADAVVSAAERLIEERPDGTYVFTVPVTASAVGEAYRATRGTRFTASPAIPGSIDIEAAADFEGGTDSETNAELVERVQQGIAPRVFSGRAQVASLFQEQYPQLVNMSQVGLGDPEMLRDRDNIFQMSTGGKADLYVQTADTPEEVVVVKECTYLGSQEWQTTIGRDDAPGFYLVRAVVQHNQTAFEGSLEVLDETRGLDLTLETDWVHAVDGLVQGAYSRYQTAVVKFKDPQTPLTVVVGDKEDYDVYILRLPNVKTLHDLTIDRSRRPQTGDYLVRAAVPALAYVSMEIRYRSGTTAPDVDAVKQAIASRINALGFKIGRLPMALIVDAAQGALEMGGTYTFTPLNLYAEIYPPDTAPDGKITVIDVNELVVPYLPERGVTQRTTVFYLPMSAINVIVKPMATLAI